MKKDMNRIRERLESLYLKFGVENEEVIKLSQELDEIILKIQRNQLEEYSRKHVS